MLDLKRSRRRKRRNKRHRKVVVCPPTEQQIEQYARTVCKRLDRQHKGGYFEPDVVQGFTGFMKLAVKIRARQLGATYEKEKTKKRAA